MDPDFDFITNILNVSSTDVECGYQVIMSVCKLSSENVTPDLIQLIYEKDGDIFDRQRTEEIYCDRSGNQGIYHSERSCVSIRDIHSTGAKAQEESEGMWACCYRPQKYKKKTC